MNDPIYRDFLRAQRRAAAAFARLNRDLCDIRPMPEPCFLVRFHCPVLVCPPGGEIHQAQGCDVGITLGPDHLRRVEPGLALTLTPHIFHPNMSDGHICLGRVAPATTMPDLLATLYEMLVWKLYTPQDCLNPNAAQWARNNRERLPLENNRPIRIPKPEDTLP